jgi:hypothetical protein
MPPRTTDKGYHALLVVAGPAPGCRLPSKTRPIRHPAKQLWSVRGAGTESPLPQNWGRYQKRLDIIKNWHRVGVVVQGTAIDGGNYSPDVYLEVESRLETPEIRCSRGRTDT